MKLPDRIETEIGDLCRQLVSAGHAVEVIEVGPMDCYEVRVGGSTGFSVVSDRGYLHTWKDGSPLSQIGPSVYKKDEQAVERFKAQVVGAAVDAAR